MQEWEDAPQMLKEGHSTPLARDKSLYAILQSVSLSPIFNTKELPQYHYLFCSSLQPSGCDPDLSVSLGFC